MKELIKNQPIHLPAITDNCFSDMDGPFIPKFDPAKPINVQWKMCVGDSLVCNPEFTNSYGTNLVLNGEFDVDASGWTLAGGVAWNAGTVAYPFSSGTGTVTRAVVITQGCLYRVKWKSSTAQTGYTNLVTLGGTAGNIHTYDNETRENSEYIIAGAGSNLVFTIGNQSGYIDDIVLELVDCCWTYVNSDDLTITTGSVCHTPNATSNVYQTISGLSGAVNYYKVVITVANLTTGNYLVYLGGTLIQTIIQSGTYTIYCSNGTLDDLFSIIISDNCDGCLNSASVQLVSQPVPDEIQVVSASGTTYNVAVDQPSFIKKDFFTLRIDVSPNPPFGLNLPNGCYHLRFKDCSGNYVITNTFMITTDLDCTKFVSGQCSCFDLGFSWFGFTLGWNVPIAKFNPEYDLLNENILDSDNHNTKIYAERGKFYNVEAGEMDEAAHDALTVMLLCDTLQINGEEFFFSKKDYNQDWDKEGKTNKSKASFQLRRQGDQPINNNCDDCE